MVDALSPTMTLREFENGYWYLEQLKNFAGRIGIPAAKKLRKDELEKAIVAFLRTGGGIAHEAVTAQDGREGRGTRPQPEAPN
jgi:hypothetical protein